MKKIIYVITTLVFIVSILLGLSRLNVSYHSNVSFLQAKVGIVIKELRSGERELSSEQYANYLEVVNNRELSVYYFNFLNLISCLLLLTTVIGFYIGILIGKKAKITSRSCETG